MILVPDMERLIASILVVPADYAALARINKHWVQILGSGTSILNYMETYYFNPWKLVKLNPDYLQTVIIQTPELCLMAVRYFGAAIQMIHNKTLELCVIALETFGWAIEYIENPTFQMCLTAVQTEPFVLDIIKDKNPLAFVILKDILNILPA